jgi:hypothetical protein
MAAYLSLISLGLIQMLLGRMAGLAELKNAWSMAQGAWEVIADFGLRISE